MLLNQICRRRKCNMQPASKKCQLLCGGHTLLTRDGFSLQDSKLNPYIFNTLDLGSCRVGLVILLYSGLKPKCWIYHSLCSDQDTAPSEPSSAEQQHAGNHTCAGKGYTPPSLQPVSFLLSHSYQTSALPRSCYWWLLKTQREIFTFKQCRERHEFWMCSKHTYTPYPFFLAPTASHSLCSPLSSSTHWTDDRINTPSLCDGIRQQAKHKKSWLESSGKIGSSCQD